MGLGIYEMIVGLEELNKKLSKIANNKETCRKILDDASMMVEREAKIKCPVSPNGGELRESIEGSIINNTQAQVATNKEYAVWVHQGTGLFAIKGDGRKDVPWHYQDEEGNWYSTVGQEPNPFLQRALEEKEEEIIEMARKKLKEDIKNG